MTKSELNLMISVMERVRTHKKGDDIEILKQLGFTIEDILYATRKHLEYLESKLKTA